MVTLYSRRGDGSAEIVTSFYSMSAEGAAVALPVTTSSELQGASEVTWERFGDARRFSIRCVFVDEQDQRCYMVQFGPRLPAWITACVPAADVCTWLRSRDRYPRERPS
jgi:hypothetical protein